MNTAVDTDPITYEVIRHRLGAICEQQAAILKTVSGSPVVTEANDFNVGLYLENGDVAVLGSHVITHAGSMSLLTQNIISEWGESPGFNDGDVFIVNDPYKGAIHLNDVSLITPIFHDGELIAWTGACSHQLDVGGMAPGSFSPAATEIQQEGICIPPTLIADSRGVRQDVWNLVTTASRLPFMVSLDLKALLATVEFGRRQLLRLIDSYGIDTTLAVMRGMTDRSEERFRARLLELPDGTFRARTYLDNDGHSNSVFRIEVEMTKEGDELTFDFERCSPQARGFVNCTISGLQGAIYSAVLPTLAYDIPWNEGALRAITVKAPLGSIVNCKHPAPCGISTLGAAWLGEAVVVETVSRLMSCHPDYAGEAMATTMGALPVLSVGGVNQYGEPFGNTFTDGMSGGAGATTDRRGIDYGGPHTIVQTSIANVETLENFSPVLFLRRGMTIDSAGPGRHRGGAGADASWMTHDTEFLVGTLSAHGIEVPNSMGLFGGLPGSLCDVKITRGSDARALLAAGEPVEHGRDVEGETEQLPGKIAALMMFPGDIFEWTFVGGGGFGDPVDADPAAVAADIVNGTVSRDEAKRLYGVVVNKALAVNEAQTRKRRTAMLEERKAWGVAKKARRLPADAAVLIRLSDKLEIVDVGGKGYHRCSCGASLGPAEDNWKDYAASTALTADALGKTTLHADITVRGYACAACGHLHSSELQTEDDEALREVEFASSSLASR